MTHISTTKKAIFVFVGVSIFAFTLPTLQIRLDVGSVLNATAVFYSILIGFYIASAMTNLSRLKTLVATETGALIACYHLCRTALPDRVDDIRKAIDIYLIKRFDYEIANYTEPTTKEYFAIFDVLKNAEPKSTGAGAQMNYIAEAEYYVAQARREITIVGAKIVNVPSWIVLNILSFMIVILLFLMRDGGLASTVATILLSSSAIISLFILSDVDGNRFGEEEFAINTYQAVFKALELDPYYPKHYIITDRHVPKELKYRSGTSKHIKVFERKV